MVFSYVYNKSYTNIRTHCTNEQNENQVTVLVNEKSQTRIYNTSFKNVYL